MSSLQALFFSLGLSAFCPFPAVSVTSVSLTLFFSVGLHPAPPPHVHNTMQLSPRGLSSAFELSYLLLFPSLLSASFLLRGAQPLEWMCSCESERALSGILNPKGSLPRQNLFISESPPSLVLLAGFAHLTSSLAAIWLCWQQLPDDGRVAITSRNVLFPPVHPAAYTLANHSFAQKYPSF